MYSKSIIKELNSASEVLDAFIKNHDNIELISEAAIMIANAFKQGNKIFSCGNGGSHCDAMHFAEELTGKYRDPRSALPAIAISDPSHISCVGNDYGYDYIFSRYLEGLAKKGDILFCLSSSGKSKNIIEAIKIAKKLDLKVIALTGNDGGIIDNMSDLQICIPYLGYADRIQEMHIKLIHIIIMIIEKEMKK